MDPDETTKAVNEWVKSLEEKLDSKMGAIARLKHDIGCAEDEITQLTFQYNKIKEQYIDLQAQVNVQLIIIINFGLLSTILCNDISSICAYIEKIPSEILDGGFLDNDMISRP